MNENKIHSVINSKIVSFVTEVVDSSKRIKVSKIEYEVKKIITCSIDGRYIDFPNIIDVLNNDEFVISVKPRGGLFRARIKIRNSENSKSQNFDFWIKKLSLKYNKETEDFELLDGQEANFNNLVFFKETN